MAGVVIANTDIDAESALILKTRKELDWSGWQNEDNLAEIIRMATNIPNGFDEARLNITHGLGVRRNGTDANHQAVGASSQGSILLPEAKTPWKLVSALPYRSKYSSRRETRNANSSPSLLRLVLGSTS